MRVDRLADMIGYDQADEDRWVNESAKSRGRTQFERDRARVVHSSALRRLGAKTQVLTPSSDDFIRTRLTHSLEVAQVGRELGKALGCDPDVVDTACLSHDLGHPPFGHHGEEVLDRIARDIGGFEGNAQTLRLLTRLEPKVIDPATGRSAGLNLTRASLDAATKYPWGAGEGPQDSQGTPTKKFGVYEEDRDVFDWLRRGCEVGRRCLEAQVMDLADDISYCVHDVEDGIVAGAIDLSVINADDVRASLFELTRQWYLPHASDDDLSGALNRLASEEYWAEGFDGTRRALAELKNMTSQLIGRFCSSAEQATRERFGNDPLTRYRGDLIIPEETRLEIAALKGLATVFVMAPRSHDSLHAHQEQIITDLAAALRDNPDQLETPFRADFATADDDGARLRVVVDQIASLTDVSAVEWHKRLCA